jgi:hypothetical protein
MTIKGALTSPSLKIACHNAATSTAVGHLPHLADLPLPTHYPGAVQLLIGVNSGLLTPLEIRSPRDGQQPYGERTALGWVVRGPSGRCNEITTASAHFVKETIHDDLSRLWQTDFEDIRMGDSKTMSIEDKRALDVMEKTTTTVDGHYQISLPWADDSALPCNREYAAARLQQVKRRLLRNPELHRMYCKQMDDYLHEGYARAAQPSLTETTTSPCRIWYLPHHPVQSAKKPDRVRVVFDSAARFKGTSINEHLLQGPDFVNNLSGVLMRFRKEPIALIADITAMFHQV